MFSTCPNACFSSLPSPVFQVEVIRDNGYGKMRHSKKQGHSPVTVIDNRDHQLAIKSDPDQGRVPESSFQKNRFSNRPQVMSIK